MHWVLLHFRETQPQRTYEDFISLGAVCLPWATLHSGYSLWRWPAALRHVGHNDADKKDDSLQPGIAQDKREPKAEQTPRKTATAVIRWMKCSISIAMGVLPTTRPEVSEAIRPITQWSLLWRSQYLGLILGWRGKSESGRLLDLVPT